jgi:hypothetical protein
MVVKLLTFGLERGYQFTFGDAWARDGHKPKSKHYDRLAIDLNLFLNGEFLDKTEDHLELGTYWKNLDPRCTWGGDWDDGNHYSWEEF